MDKYLLLFEKHFKKGMLNKDFEAFKRSHPTLLRCILSALEEVDGKEAKYSHYYLNSRGGKVFCNIDISPENFNYLKQNYTDFKVRVKNQNGVGVLLKYSELTAL